MNYDERMALPPNATVLVQLVDVFLADASAQVIAEDRIIAATGSPVPYRLRFDQALIKPRRTSAGPHLRRQPFTVHRYRPSRGVCRRAQQYTHLGAARQRATALSSRGARLVQLESTTMHQALAPIFRSIAIATVSAALVSAAHAQQMDSKMPRQRPQTAKPVHTAGQKPLARPRTTTSCSEFGAGFVRMPGSDSCIRFGGGVEMGVGAVP